MVFSRRTIIVWSSLTKPTSRQLLGTSDYSPCGSTGYVEGAVSPPSRATLGPPAARNGARGRSPLGGVGVRSREIRRPALLLHGIGEKELEGPTAQQEEKPNTSEGRKAKGGSIPDGGRAGDPEDSSMRRCQVVEPRIGSTSTTMMTIFI